MAESSEISWNGSAGLPAASLDASVPAAIARPAILIAGAIAVLAAGCLVGYQVWPGIASPGAARLLRAESGSMVYATAVLLALALLVTLLQSSNLALWRRSPFAGRAEKPAPQFVEEAKQCGISLRVAREGYHLLQHHYPRPMCIDLHDRLQRDLRMTSANILSLRAGLLGRTDRLEQDLGADRSIATVQQLLESVEAAPRNGVGRARQRQRVADLAFASRPVVENLEFTAASALADPDFLRRAHFKWLRRRAADYAGFRSRESDRDGGAPHPGPFRRGTELSRRLAVKQEAGRLAKHAADKTASDRPHLPDHSSTSAAHHGY